MSSESSRADADLSESEQTQTGTAQTAASPDGSLRASQQPRQAASAAPGRAAGPPASDPHLNASDFGANQWLVDELYQRYLADPGSVDQAWWSFFSDYRSGRQPRTREAASPTARRRAAAAQRPGRTREARRACVRRPLRPPRAPAAPAPAAPATPARPAPATPAPPATPPRAAQPPGRAACRRVSATGCAARPPGRPSNMASSLVVPTATSVRDIPAKLLIDNRIVINNHLRRGRGGKVSFTHLIGYAVVRALDAVPAMNDSFAEDDGKPVLVAPDHVNLGLAIDVSKDDGSRQLLVPNIKGAESHGFPAVLDRVRGRRAQGAHRQADGRGLRGHHDQPDQPGHDRDRPLDPAADAGPGLHRRGRRDGIPGRLPGRRRKRPSPGWPSAAR